MSVAKNYVQFISAVFLSATLLFSLQAHSEVQVPPDAFVGAPMDYGSGRQWGMQACPYDYKTVDDYDTSGSDRSDRQELKKKKKELDLKKSALRKFEGELAGILFVSKYKKFVVQSMKSRSCEAWDHENGMGSNLTGPWNSSEQYAKLCVKGEIQVSVLCQQKKEIYKSYTSGSPDRCENLAEKIHELNEEVAQLEIEVTELDADIRQRKIEREAEAEWNRAYNESEDRDTEAHPCPDGNCEYQKPKISGWQWGLAAGLDALMWYGTKRGYDKDAQYRARLGYPPLPYRAYPYPVATLGMLGYSLSGVGAGAWGCAGGYAGGGFGYGPAGMFGPMGVYAGAYGGAGMGMGGPWGGGGGPWGYPGGMGFPGGGWGVPGYPGGGAFLGVGIGGFAGGYPGGFPVGFGGGYPGMMGGMYPGGFGGGYPGMMGGGIGGGFGFPGMYGGMYPGGFGGGYPGMMGGGIGGGFGFPGMYGGMYPGGFGGGYPGMMGGGFGMPGMMGGGFGMPGMMGGGFGMPGMMGGGFGMPGMMGGGFGGAPGYMGGGFQGGMGGAGGFMGGQMQWEFQQRQMQLYMEYMRRAQENQRNKQETMGRLYQQIMMLQQQLMQIQYEGGAGGGGYLGGGFNIGIGIGGGGYMGDPSQQPFPGSTGGTGTR